MSRGKISIVIAGQKTKPPEPKKDENIVIGGRYALQDELGRGGVGEVTLAYDLQLERPVAVKRILLRMGGSSSRKEFAMTEAKRLARLQHPNIVTVYDVLDHRGDLHMVMEYLNGYTVEALESPLTLEDFINLARQSLGGLAAAHSLGMIHLDIKATNIMLSWLATGQLQVKLLDFGLARMLGQADPTKNDEDGTVLGSIYNMAPEQLERNPLDVRTDLYSLGCVFYLALTRLDPFQGESVEEIIDAHLRNDFSPLAPLRPDLPPGLCAWVEKLMSREPGDRPPTANAALSELLSSPNLGTRNLRATKAHELSRPLAEIHLPAPELLQACRGKKAAIHGRVTRVWENMPGTICFLNFDGVDHRDFSVLILKDEHPDFSREKLDKLASKKVRVAGEISDFHGSPQLVVKEPSQIDLLED